MNDSQHSSDEEEISLSDICQPTHPRRVVIDDIRWMRPYYRVEQIELSERLSSGRADVIGFGLWQRAYVLFREVFVGFLDYGTFSDPIFRIAAENRSKLLALAGTTAKPTLDVLMAGYYWMASGQIRSLLETWRYVAFLRVEPGQGLIYLNLPSISPVRTDGSTRSVTKRLEGTTVNAAVTKLGDEKDKKYLALVNAGFAQFQAGAHPSAEGLMQLESDVEGRLIFGPNSRPKLRAFFLQWGLAALVMLLDELYQLAVPPQHWQIEYVQLRARFGEWITSYNQRFPNYWSEQGQMSLVFRIVGNPKDLDAVLMNLFSEEEIRDRIGRHYRWCATLGASPDIARKLTMAYADKIPVDSAVTAGVIDSVCGSH